MNLLPDIGGIQRDVDAKFNEVLERLDTLAELLAQLVEQGEQS